MTTGAEVSEGVEALARALRTTAEAALRPCSLCSLTVPHAFEDPDAHTWDPNHVTVNPTALIELLDAIELSRRRLRRIPRFGVVDGVIAPHHRGTMVRLDDALVALLKECPAALQEPE